MSKPNIKKNKGRFAGIPFQLLTLKSYTHLSPLAKSLLFELAGQYNGKNNGYLSLTRNDLKARGFNSPGSNQKAIQELIDAHVITKTLQGGIGCGTTHCSLYGINWQPSDERIDRPFQTSMNVGIKRLRLSITEGDRVFMLLKRTS